MIKDTARYEKDASARRCWASAAHCTLQGGSEHLLIETKRVCRLSGQDEQRLNAVNMAHVSGRMDRVNRLVAEAEPGLRRFGLRAHSDFESYIARVGYSGLLRR